MPTTYVVRLLCDTNESFANTHGSKFAFFGWGRHDSAHGRIKLLLLLSQGSKDPVSFLRASNVNCVIQQIY